MKILLIVPEYPPYHIGGGGIVFQNIAEYLVKLGHEVMVAYGYHQTRLFFEKPRFYKRNNVKLVQLPLLPTPISKVFLTSVMPPNILSVVYLIKLIYQEKTDVVHLHGYGFPLIDISAMICRIFNKKYIITLHGTPKTPDKKGGNLKMIFNLYSKIFGNHTLTYSKKITCVSKSVMNESVFSKFKYKIKIIYNGINLDIYKNKENKNKENLVAKRYSLDSNAYVILSIGRIQWLKGFQFAIEAINLILRERQNVVYLIAGKDGGYQQQLKELTIQLGLDKNVIFPGFLDIDDKKSLIFDSDVILIPSLEESFGLVGLEAMATGTPIISSKSGGLGEYLEDNKTALIINPYDPQDIKNKLNRLIDDDILRESLIKNGLKTVKNFEWILIVDKYLKVYGSI